MSDVRHEFARKMAAANHAYEQIAKTCGLTYEVAERIWAEVRADNKAVREARKQ